MKIDENEHFFGFGAESCPRGWKVLFSQGNINESWESFSLQNWEKWKIMKFLEFLDFMVKSWKSENSCTFHRFLGFGGTSTLQKSLKMLTNTIHFHSWLSRCPIFAKKAENAHFALKIRKSAIFHEISIIFTKIAILRFLRFPDLRGPRGAPGGAGRGPQGLPTRNFEKSKMLRNRYRQPKRQLASTHL